MSPGTPVNQFLGVGKMPQHALDVNGDVNCSGKFMVNSVPISGGGGGSQTPWQQNIDAAGYSLDNCGGITFADLGFGPAQIVTSANQSLGLTINSGSGNLNLVPAPGWDIRCAGRLQADNWFTVTGGIVILLNLPTSPAGLVPGQIWNNSGVLNIV